MSKYPLDDNVLQEEYEALLIKLALKEYAAEQSEALMRENMEVPQTQPKQKDRVIAAGRMGGYTQPGSPWDGESGYPGGGGVFGGGTIFHYCFCNLPGGPGDCLPTNYEHNR